MFNCFTWLERYDPQVGYCQGLPFVVAILLLNVRESILIDTLSVYQSTEPL
jgi:aarF domain-containing kinase